MKGVSSRASLFISSLPPSKRLHELKDRSQAIEGDISRPIYITRRTTRLPYVRSTVHMYAYIARGLTSRSSFRYQLAWRLFEERRRRSERLRPPRWPGRYIHASYLAPIDRPASGANDYHLGHFPSRTSPRLNGPSTLGCNRVVIDAADAKD